MRSGACCAWYGLSGSGQSHCALHGQGFEPAVGSRDSLVLGGVRIYTTKPAVAAALGLQPLPPKDRKALVVSKAADSGAATERRRKKKTSAIPKHHDVHLSLVLQVTSSNSCPR